MRGRLAAWLYRQQGYSHRHANALGAAAERPAGAELEDVMTTLLGGD